MDIVMRQGASPPSSDRILAAAERVFAQEGYGQASLRRVIAAARVSTTAFYARFSSKEAVLEALVARLLADLHAAAVAELSHTRGVGEAIDRGVEVLVATLAPRRQLVRLALTEAAASDLVRPTLGDAYKRLAELLAVLLETPTRRGANTGRDFVSLAWAIVGALKMQIIRWAVFDQLDDVELTVALRASARSILPRSTRAHR
jgi:AcrR family transcriptional regulator